MKDARRSLVRLLETAALYSGIILISDTIGLGLDSVFLGKNMFRLFTLFTLGEAALMFLVGGAIDVRGSVSFSKVRNHVTKTAKGWDIEGHRKAQSKAAPLILTGIILLLLSFALAYPLR